MTKRRTYLIQDPDGDYSLELIRRIFTQFGLRPVCFYTDPRTRFYSELANPLLRGDMIEESYDVGDLAEFAESLRDTYEVVGIVPHSELTIGPAADLCELLNINWNPPETIRRFRDKNALKQHLHDVGIRVPRCWLIDDARSVWRERLPERFVLKPNDGYGNIGVGMFERSDLSAAETHMATITSVTWLLEEYIGGREFNINGQVRADGRVEIYAIFEYARRRINGFEFVYDTELQCASTDPEFDTLVRYSTDVMDATGLRRSPFHLEVKVDEDGPCMIDLAARMGGCGVSHTISRSHPGFRDLFAIAAYDYIVDADIANEPVDWPRHDANLSMLVYGFSDADTVIQSLAGIEAVEALPEFVAWKIKPHIGDHIRPTTELYSAPYLVDLRRPPADQDVGPTIEHIRALIRWNVSPGRAANLAAKAKRKMSRLPRRLRWELHRVLGRFRRRS